jgi:hypothetical protein
MKFNAEWLWYDFWVGVYWSRATRTLYICPLPTFVLSVSWGAALQQEGDPK